MAFHATPKDGGLPLFIRASILPIMIATVFLMQIVLIDADHNWRVVVRKVDHSPSPPQLGGPIHVLPKPPIVKPPTFKPPPLSSKSPPPPPLLRPRPPPPPARGTHL